MSLCTWVRCEWDLFLTPDSGVINFQSVQFHNSSTSAMAEQSQNDSLYNQDSYGRRWKWLKTENCWYQWRHPNGGALPTAPPHRYWGAAGKGPAWSGYPRSMGPPTPPSHYHTHTAALRVLIPQHTLQNVLFNGERGFINNGNIVFTFIFIFVPVLICSEHRCVWWWFLATIPLVLHHSTWTIFNMYSKEPDFN